MMRSSVLAAIALVLCAAPAGAAQSGAYLHVTGYPISAADAYIIDGITSGPDGALWFTDYTGYIGRITTSGAVTLYPGPTISPYGITEGTDGALWFTEYLYNIGRIDTSGKVTEYQVTSDASNLFGIVSGPDGALWFTEALGRIGRITTDGAVTWFAVPTANSTPLGIAVGPDGALWFTEETGNQIGRITTSGAVTEYAIPTANSSPIGIAAGPDGALWFAEWNGDKIGRITTTGSISEYAGASGAPAGITAGPDGALWFTVTNTSHIGRITTSGVITEYPTPHMYSNFPITTGPDGALWFAASGAVSTVIGRAPACGLGFSASFAGGALTMNYDLGINTPADFEINLLESGKPVAEPISQQIPAVVPAHPFTMTWNGFPNLGEVTVQPVLADRSGQPLCSEWTTVDTTQ